MVNTLRVSLATNWGEQTALEKAAHNDITVYKLAGTSDNPPVGSAVSSPDLATW